MAWSLVCQRSQNPHLGGKNKLAGIVSTEDSNISAMSRVSICAVAPIIAPAVDPAIALSFVAQYLEKDF